MSDLALTNLIPCINLIESGTAASALIGHGIRLVDLDGRLRVDIFTLDPELLLGVDF